MNYLTCEKEYYFWFSFMKSAKGGLVQTRKDIQRTNLKVIYILMLFSLVILFCLPYSA